MKKRAEKQGPGQVEIGPAATGLLTQMLMPMIVGLAESKRALQDLVYECGLAATEALFAHEAERVAGRKHERRPGRESYHWGRTETAFPFGGRTAMLQRPRVRHVEGHEVRLPLVDSLQHADPLPERVIEQILLGVSTRGYAPSLGRAPTQVRTRGDSKSAASRHIVAETSRRVTDFLGRKLDELDICVLMLDAIHVAGQAVVVALGADVHGTKHPLGLWIGSTENKVLCTELLQNLLGRGLRITGKVLTVIDGGKGLRAAIADVLGDAALVQRCQNHKLRNVRDHLPKSRQAYAVRAMRDAYRSDSHKTAKGRLRQLVSWLENNGEDDAAASLREGLDETITVIGLGLSRTLTRSLATTNAIENLMGSIRRTSRNVKKWRSGSMIKRWVALALSAAQRKFRRLKGHRDMPALVAVLRPAASTLDQRAVNQ